MYSDLQSELQEVVSLSDGTAITVRPIRPDDAARLQRLHARLSPESVYFRFLAKLKGLSDKQAHEFANVDYSHQMALVATREDNGQESVIAVARYAVGDPARPDEAEAAIVVEDSYQGKGLGTLLLERLIGYAREHGISTMLASVHPENNRIMHVLDRLGLPSERHREGDLWEVRLNLERDAEDA